MKIALVQLLYLTVLCGLASGGEPELTVVQEGGMAHPDEPFWVNYEFSWEGDPGDFTVFPMEIEAFEWGDATLESVHSTFRDGRNRVWQRIGVVAWEVGDFKMPRVEVNYVDINNLEVVQFTEPEDDGAQKPPYLSISAPSFPIVVRPDRTLYWVIGASVSFLLLTLGLLAWRFRSKTGEAEAPEAAGSGLDLALTRKYLHSAKRHRLDGKLYDFYQGLVHSLSGLGVTDGDRNDLRARLETRAQEVGYRGVVPTHEEMDAALREVERLVSQESSTET